MTATFVSYNVASRAMETSQASINVVGNNISNVNTEGYTRQRVDIVSVTESGKIQKYATPQVSSGLGAKATGTTQLRDPYIDTRYRNQTAEKSRYETMVNGLSNLQDVFDEASDEALQGELSSFINNLQSLSQTPTSSDIAQVVRSAAGKITQMVNMYSTQLDQIRSEQTENLKVTVNSEFKTYVENIASLNQQIQREEIYGNKPNELYDQRNLLIDKLSTISNIKVNVTQDEVSENLKIAHYNISIEDPSGKNPITIVDNDKFAKMSLDETDPLNVKLTVEDTDGNERTDANNLINDGKLQAYLNVINGKGGFADAALKENDAKGIYYYNEKLNIFAKQFAEEFNQTNSEIYVKDGAGSYVLNSYATNPLNLFTDDTGITTTNITAKNLRLSAAWLSNPSYIETTRNPELDPTPTGYKATPASSDNIVRMIGKMSDKHDFKDGLGKTIMSGTFNEYMTGMVSEVGTDVQLNTSFSKTATNVFQTISDSRDEVSGISLNEEGINLSAFQKIYNASLRYFNVLDENLDSIINKMGV